MKFALAIYRCRLFRFLAAFVLVDDVFCYTLSSQSAWRFALLALLTLHSFHTRASTGGRAAHMRNDCCLFCFASLVSADKTCYRPTKACRVLSHVRTTNNHRPPASTAAQTPTKSRGIIEITGERAECAAMVLVYCIVDLLLIDRIRNVMSRTIWRHHSMLLLDVVAERVEWWLLCRYSYKQAEPSDGTADNW